MRTHSADRSRQRYLVFDQLDRRVVCAVGDQTHIALTIGVGRAVELTGRHTVAVVRRHQQLHGDLARLHHALALGVDHHTLADLCGAGTQELRDTLGFHHAQAASAVNLDRLVIAKGGDVNTVLPCRFQNRCALRGCHLFSVDCKMYHFSALLIPSRPRRICIPRSIFRTLYIFPYQ